MDGLKVMSGYFPKQSASETGAAKFALPRPAKAPITMGYLTPVISVNGVLYLTKESPI